MENVQPPNYYGVPYPNQMDNGMKPPYPNMPNYNEPNNLPPRPNMSRDETNSNQDNQTYFTRILSNHTGEEVSVYCSFTDSADWHDQVFEGTLIDSGDDYVILDETKIKKQVLILAVYIHFIEFNGKKGK